MMWSRLASRIVDRRAGLVVVGIALLVFAPTLVLQSVEYDDHWLWAADSPLRDLDLSYVFFELDAKARRPLGGEYLPVRDIAVALDMAIFGEDLYGPHAVQLLLYLVTIYALGGLLVRFGMRPAIAWVGTLLFAVHPIHVESVAWLSERKGILAALFVVGCGRAWVKYRQGGAPWWIAIAAVCSIAGVWSKAPAMFAPAVFAAWDLLLLPAARRRWIAIAAVGGAVALAAVPVIVVARDARVIAETRDTQPSRVASALGAKGHYVQSAVLAEQPSVAYPMQTDGPSAADLGFGALAIAASIVLVVLRKRFETRWPLALLAWAWLWFVPISHLVVRVHILVADRYALLWVLAPCVAAAWLIETRLRGSLRFVVGAVLVCSLAIVSLRAQAAWTSSIELFAVAIESNPRDARLREALAIAYAREGRIPEALAVTETGLAMEPEHPYLLQRKARLLSAVHGRMDDALAIAARVAETGKASAMATYASLLRDAGRPAEALPWAEKAAARQPAIAEYAQLVRTLRAELAR